MLRPDRMNRHIQAKAHGRETTRHPEGLEPEAGVSEEATREARPVTLAEDSPKHGDFFTLKCIIWLFKAV